MITSNLKGFDDLLGRLEKLRKGIEKGAEQAVREVGRDYYEHVKAKLYELAGEHEGQEPAYVAKTLHEMADKLKLDIKKGRDGYRASIGWEEGSVEDLEHILYGNRDILPVDVFGEEGEMNRAFE